MLRTPIAMRSLAGYEMHGLNLGILLSAFAMAVGQERDVDISDSRRAPTLFAALASGRMRKLWRR